MNKFEKVKYYYDHGFWSIDRVRNAVVKGWITAEQFKEITGEDYEE
ncbi:MAG: XkdX family protein [Clostridia bacterium]|nr:XkdX family protein [Clostridia bacterium]